MRIGAHLSVAQGYAALFEYADEVGCECAQIFVKSPRQWQGPPTSAESGSLFRALREERGFGPVFSHTAYLINLSTDNEALRSRSVAALADELHRAALLELDAVVTHIGTTPAGDTPAAAARVVHSVLDALSRLDAAEDGPRLLLENTAGAGTSFGCELDQLALVIDGCGLPPERLGICLDTCHAFAYGFPLGDAAGWADVLRQISDGMGLDRLGLIHANDCMFERGSKRDRHAWIGEGSIGYAGFLAMVCSEGLSDVCAVTEMPGERPEKDVENIRRLRNLRDSCGNGTAESL